MVGLLSFGGLTVNEPAPSSVIGHPNIVRARLLCQAYDTYRAFSAGPLLSFEHAVFLVTTLARADELKLDQCLDCGAVLVADRLSLRVPVCTACHGVSRAENRPMAA
jgi:hypothetical protein